MCTSLALPEHALYGRNLDLDTHFDEQVLLAPRGLAFAFRHLPPLPPTRPRRTARSLTTFSSRRSSPGP